jgi:hypothetical protein
LRRATQSLLVFFFFSGVCLCDAEEMLSEIFMVSFCLSVGAIFVWTKEILWELLKKKKLM